MPQASLAEVTTERPRPRPRLVDTSPTAISSGSNNAIWTIWTGGGSITSSTTTNTEIFRIWVSSPTTTGSILAVGNSNAAANTITFGSSDIWSGWVKASNLTKEQVQAQLLERQRQQEEYRQRQIQLEAENAKARERAQRLLQENLDAKQQAELAEKGYFDLDVISKNGERRRYRIHRKWSHSIHQIDPANGQRVKTLCIHPREQTPVEDSMLAQKLMLEGGMEDELLRIANHS